MQLPGRSSRSACATQLRIAWAVGSNCLPSADNNTAVPVRPDDHYAIPPLDRMDVEELLALIRARRYFVLQDSLVVLVAWCVDDDGRLDMTKLLTAFSAFFGEHAEHWLGISRTTARPDRSSSCSRTCSGW